MRPKRRTGTRSTRTDSGNISLESSELQDVGNLTSDQRDEQNASSPRKRAKTAPKANLQDSDDAKLSQNDEMDLGEPSIHNATSSHNTLLESDAADAAEPEAIKLQPKPDDSVGSAESINSYLPGDKMDVDNPIDSVSQKLENVDMATPVKQVQSTPITERSSRSKAKAKPEDVDMTDELSSTLAPQSVRRSGRTRKPIASYDEDKPQEIPKKQPETPAPKSQTSKSASVSKSKQRGVWTAEHLLTSKRSKLINAEANMIFNEDTWSLFSDEEKEELLSLLHPVDTEITDPDFAPGDRPPRIPTPILFQNLNNDAFRTAFAELQEDLSTGSYEPTYIKQAQEALEKRLGPLADAVDDVKNKEFEEYWGQKQSVYSGDAGEAANVTLYELCRHRYFKPGDVFEYKRAFLGSVTVEKVLKLEKIEMLENAPGVQRKKDACTLTFKCPPGTKKFLSQSHKESQAGDDTLIDASGEPVSNSSQGTEKSDITLKVHNLAQLDVAILDEDGSLKASDPEKYKKYPAGNSWKFFMVRRNDEYVGSPFMIRQTFYEKVASK